MDHSLTPGYHVRELKYLSSIEHQLLGVGNNRPRVDTTGLHGENLTIAVLTMNRSSLTLRLMDSIATQMPDFAGEFLIGDNGSEASEKRKIYNKMDEMPFKCRMLEFDKNYGVAKGRNMLFGYVKTDWLLQLDNDVYFICNPLSQIQQNISQLGCHFLSMPVLNHESREAFVYGGHLYVEYLHEKLSIGGGSGYISQNVQQCESHDPFICTFVSGCASVLNKETFFACGGYDEGMFVGFEDTEFSLRVFQHGLKVGACGIPAIIHDHPKPEIKADADYERQRFSNVKLYEAAMHFESKHGFQVWNPFVENWIQERLMDLLGEAPGNIVKTKNITEQKKKVLVVVDKPNWALDHIARQIFMHCSDEYEIHVFYLSDITYLYQVFFAGRYCDIIHFLWRSWLRDIFTSYNREYPKLIGMSTEDFEREFIHSKNITLSVYDHLFLNDEDFEITQKLFSNPDSPISVYSVSSEILRQLYVQDERIGKKPSAVITDGVDLDIFTPQKLERFKNRKPCDLLIVGWSGNSKWSADKEDFKGVHTILKPTIDELQSEGYPIELKLQDSSVSMTPHHKMPDFYNSLDVYVCTSKIEGTPNPILECMACGVPFVSTNVGIVAEVAGEIQSKYILEERSVASLKAKLIQLINQPNALMELSSENLVQIKDWNWKIRAKEFVKLWSQI